MLTFIYVPYLWYPIRNKLIKRFREFSSIQEISKVSPHCEHHQASIGIPRMCKPAFIYLIFSSITHVLNCFINLFIILDVERRWTGTDTTITCHLPRLVIHKSFAQQYMTWFSLLFSSLHILWRLLVLLYEREFEINMFPFLIWDDETLKRALKFNDAYLDLGFKQNILFFKYVDTSLYMPKLMLRPNRTFESREKLKHLVKIYYLSVMIGLLVTGLIMLPVSIGTIFLEHKLIFEGCNLISVDFAYVFRSLMSILIAFLMFWDGFAALSLPSTFGFVIISDLLIYWQVIEDKLIKVKHILTLQRELNDNDDDDDDETQQTLNFHYKINSRSYYHRKSCVDQYESILEEYNYGNKIKSDMLELQYMLEDFFKQLRHVDKYVTILMPFIIFGWLGFNGLLSTIGLQSAVNYLFRTLQLIAVILIYLVGHNILRVRAKTEPAYKLISSIVAMDSSCDKRQWLILLEYYTEKPSHAFTLFHSRIFTRFTLLQAISYTFSFVFVMETLRRNNWTRGNMAPAAVNTS